MRTASLVAAAAAACAAGFLGWWALRSDSPLAPPPEARSPEPAPSSSVPPDAGARGVLSGTLRSADGTPLAETRVSARRDEKGPSRGTRTDAAGRFRMEGLEPGEWRFSVIVFGAAGADFGDYTVEVARPLVRGGENSLDLRLFAGDLAAEIAGRVFEKATGRPLKVNLFLEPLVPAEGGGFREGPIAAGAGSTGGGAFRIRALRAGRYRLEAWPTGDLRLCARDLDLAAGERKEGLEMAME